MAKIDVSELMNDPDFVNNFTIIRRTPTVNTYGENTFVEASVPAVGSIQTATGETLKRLPDGAQLSNFKTIFTKTQLIADIAGGYSDIILYKNLRYEVRSVYPWDDYGAGWFMADVEIEKVSL